MKACFGIPWRGTDHNRIKAYNYVHAHLQQLRLEILTDDANPAEPFSRAASRNSVVRWAETCGYDHVILHDADMVAPLSSYEIMLKTADLTQTMVVGYTEYRALGEKATNWILGRNAFGDPFALRTNQVTYAWSLGGIVVISVENFNRVGGYDERFTGWGCEDTAFAIACGIVLGPNQRTTNAAVHLWHQHGMVKVDPAQLEANGNLLARYNAVTDVAGLRAVQGIG